MERLRVAHTRQRGSCFEGGEAFDNTLIAHSFSYRDNALCQSRSPILVQVSSHETDTI